MIWKPFFFIFLGGGIGSVTRYAVSMGVLKFSKHFPLGTFISNISASILLAVILLYLEAKGTSNNELRLFLVTGFCGGFSTFSTFSFETFELLKSGHTTLAFINVAGSVIAAVLSIYILYKMYHQV